MIPKSQTSRLWRCVLFVGHQTKQKNRREAVQLKRNKKATGWMAGLSPVKYVYIIEIESVDYILETVWRAVLFSYHWRHIEIHFKGVSWAFKTTQKAPLKVTVHRLDIHPHSSPSPQLFFFRWHFGGSVRRSSLIVIIGRRMLREK